MLKIASVRRVKSRPLGRNGHRSQLGLSGDLPLAGLATRPTQKIAALRPRIPWWKGLGADSKEKHEPASDIDTAVTDSLKALNPKRPIRKADMLIGPRSVRVEGQSDNFAKS